MAWGDRYKSNPFGYGGPAAGNRSWATGEEMAPADLNTATPRPQELQLKNINPQSRNVSDFDTSQLDASDPRQVMELQRSLGITVDGIFGPQTEAAYRSAINRRRSQQGLDEYQYNSRPQSYEGETLADDEYYQTSSDEGYRGYQDKPMEEPYSINYEVKHPLVSSLMNLFRRG